MSRRGRSREPGPPPLATNDPGRLPRIVWLDGFAAKWDKLKMAHEDAIRLESAIIEAGESPATRTDVGHLRKIRFSPEKWGTGKRDALRVCYAIYSRYGVVFLVTLYGKGEKSNLNRAEKTAIGELLREVETLLAKGQI